MSFVVILLSIPSTAFCLTLDLAVGPATPFNLTEFASSLVKPESIKWYEDSTEWAAVVLDYTYSVPLSLQLLQTAPDSLVICMYEGCPTEEISSRLSVGDFTESLEEILTRLPFENVFLLSSALSRFQLLSSELSSLLPLLFSHSVIINPASDQLTLINLVGKVLKPTGTNLGLLLLDQVSGENVLLALQEYELLGAGFAYVSVQESVWGGLDSGTADGLICVGDRELAGVRSREEFEVGLLKSQIETLERAEREGLDSPAALRAQLASLYNGKSRNATACVINIQHTSPILTSLSSLQFPGNTTCFPAHTQAILPVSVGNSPIESDGSLFPQIVIINRGFSIGYSDVNNRSDILPTFNIQVNSVGYGVILFDSNWALTQIEKNPKAVGLAHHPVALSPNIMGLTRDFSQMEMEVPIVSVPGDTALSDPNNYPLFLRTIPNNRYTALVMIRFFALFGWKQAAILSSYNEEDLNFCDCFKNASQSYSVNITNSHQYLPSTFDSAQEELNQTLCEILASNTRIIMISHPSAADIILRMYDFGVRSGDYLLILAYGLSYTYIAGVGEDYHRLRVVAKGAISFIPSYFTGTVGERIRQEFIAVDGNNYYPAGCSHYDCAMLVSLALDYMIVKGLHYERGRDLASAMRGTRFIGCIGRVQIEQGTNDNIKGDQVIINMHYNEGNDTAELFTVASYSPDRAVMFTFTGHLEWPNGLPSFPDSWEMDSACPYLEKDIVDFPKGQAVGFAACFGFSGLIGVVTVFIWRKWWQEAFPQFTTEEFISIEDVLMFVNIPLDFLQFAAVAPDISITSLTQDALHIASFHLEFFLDFTAFLGIEIAVFVMVLVYVLIFTIKLLGVDGKLRKWDCCSFIDYWVDLLLPTFGNVLFLPIIFTLLSTFNCYRSVGKNYSDSFLNRDCAEKCWAGKHLYYVSIAAACLVVYTPIAVFTRPLWQDMQPNLHFKALPLYLMFKSVLQMFLISASVTLKFSYQTVHAVVYLALMSVYLCFLLKFQAYNYARASLWHFLVVVALWLYGLTGLLHSCLSAVSPLIVAAVLGGVYVCLVLVGLLLQRFKHKYRSLLKRQKGPDRSDIVKFAFTFGKVAAKHLANFRAKQRTVHTADTHSIVLHINT